MKGPLKSGLFSMAVKSTIEDKIDSCKKPKLKHSSAWFENA